jgi:hypothetical protein
LLIYRNSKEHVLGIAYVVHSWRGSVKMPGRLRKSVIGVDSVVDDAK